MQDDDTYLFDDLIIQNIDQEQIFDLGRLITITYGGNTYTDVIFCSNSKSVFLAQIHENFEKTRVDYNDGKILIYNGFYDSITNSYFITKVITLYNILDDTFYCVTEEKALKIFDLGLSREYLKKPNNYILRTDPVKKKHQNNKKVLCKIKKINNTIN